MSNAAAERFAIENDLELDEVINFFKGVDTGSEGELN